MLMKICISGLTGSGKTTLGAAISDELGIRHISQSYKNAAVSDAKLLKMLENTTARYALEFDENIIKESKHIDCVITTWHCPWIIKDATLRIWLDSDEKNRAYRLSKEKKKSIKYCIKYIRKKDALTAAQYRRAYHKDFDLSAIDIRINSDAVSVSEAVSVISMLAMLRDKKKFA